MPTLNAAYFTVTYTISPEIGSNVYNGDRINVSGTITAGAQATQIRSIAFGLMNSNGKYMELAYVNRSIGAGGSGSFAFATAVTQNVVDLIPAGQDSIGLALCFTVYDSPGGEGGYGAHHDTAMDSKYATHVLYVHRYRIKPMITSAEFMRVRNGVADNEGTQVACRNLKVRLEDGVSIGGLTERTLTVTNTANAAEKYTVNLSDAVLQAALTQSGYSETAPVLLAGRTFPANNSYRIELTLGNGFIRAIYVANIDRAFANMHLSGASTGGVAFGQFSTSTEGNPKLECKYPAYFHGGISGVTDFTSGEIATGGHWINGKPIYRYVGSANWTATGEVYLTNVLTSSNVDALISCGGYLENNAWRIPVGFQGYNGTQYNFSIYLATTGLTAHIGTGLTANKTIVYWVEYTKA